LLDLPNNHNTSLLNNFMMKQADVEIDFELPFASVDAAEPFDPTWVLDP
jgi:hypothetical protein